jgi:hypothetical protein
MPAYEFDETQTSDTVAHGHIAESAMQEAEEIESLHDRMLDAFGPEGGERHELTPEEEAAKAAALVKEHGADYHGFGHPPEPKD